MKFKFKEDISMFNRSSFVIVTILLISLAINAQTFTKKANDAYNKKNYSESAKLYVQAVENGENEAPNAYNAACSFALIGDKETAFTYLQKSVDLGYTNVRHMTSDSDLKSLHSDARWKKIIDEAKAKNKATKEFWESPALITPYKENISEDEKIAGLSKMWSEVKYNFVNFDLVPDVKWDELYVEYLPKVRNTKSTFEYLKVLREMIAKLQDGHSNMFFPKEVWARFYSRPPLITGLVENKVVVTQILADKVRQKGIRVGQEVTAIDGIPVKEYAKKYVIPYQSSSTKQDLFRRSYGIALFAGDLKKDIRLSLVSDKGGAFEAILKRYKVMNFNIYELEEFPRKRRAIFEFKVLPNNIGYVALNTFGTNIVAKEFEKNFAKISKTDALIIDIRRNGGGNSGNGWRILSSLTGKPFRTSKWHTRDYKPAFRAWGRQEEKHGNSAGTYPADKSKYYDKPVVVITGPATFSAAEDFAVAFDSMDRGLIIGEPTAGSTGQPLFFRLTGGGSARVTTKRDSYPDGKEFVGVGVKPDKLITPTIKDLRMGKDTVLEAAKMELKSLIKK